MLIIAGTIKAEIANWDAARAAIEHMCSASQNEPGCLAYQIYRHPADANGLFIFEKWQDEAALNAHFQAPHMAEFNDFLHTVNIAEMDIRRYEVSAETQL